MIIGGYGFSGNARAGMDGPFMPPVNATVQFDKLSFLLPIVVGAVLFAAGIFSVVKAWRNKALQLALAIAFVVFLLTLWDVVTVFRLIAASAKYYPLDNIIRAETSVLCCLYSLWGWRRLRSLRRVELSENTTTMQPGG